MAMRPASRPEWTCSGIEPVSPGVFRIPLPQPDDTVGAVNVYTMIDEAERLTMIDSGWAQAEPPLRAYLGSLNVVRALPDMRLLPAHGPVVESAHSRIDELLVHHQRRLDECATAVERGSGLAHEVAARIAWTSRAPALSELHPVDQMRTVLETAAHLDILVSQGILDSAQVDGAVVYQS